MAGVLHMFPYGVKSVTSEEPKGGSMVIVSWNVNGLRAAIAAGSLDVVATFGTDVLCLQEIRTKERPVVIEGFAHSFYPAERDGYAGTAIVSRVRPASVELGFGTPDLDSEGRVITAEYGAFYLVNVYVPRSVGDLRRQDYRVRFDDALVSHVESLETHKPVIVCGDFNAILDDDDVYEESAHRGEHGEGFASDERDLLLALVDAGYVDAFRRAHPGAEGAYTWWSQRRNRRALNRGWRLDYFFVSGAISDRIADVRHLAEVGGSDHCPVLLELAV